MRSGSAALVQRQPQRNTPTIDDIDIDIEMRRRYYNASLRLQPAESDAGSLGGSRLPAMRCDPLSAHEIRSACRLA